MLCIAYIHAPESLEATRLWKAFHQRSLKCNLNASLNDHATRRLIETRWVSFVKMQNSSLMHNLLSFHLKSVPIGGNVPFLQSSLSNIF